MLIVNADHLCLAGVASLEEPCTYCSRPLAAYPLIMSDDRSQTVYHVTCALELVTDLLVDLATFFPEIRHSSEVRGYLAPLGISWRSGDGKASSWH